MKKRTRLIAMLAILFAIGGFTLSEAFADSRDADHEALRALKAKVVTAIVEQDVDAIANCFTAPFVFTTIDQTVITDKQGIADYYRAMLKTPSAPLTKVNIEVKPDALTHFVDQNTGICVGKSEEAYTLKDGKIFRMHARWTATVVKEDGMWKIAAAHVGINILDNPILTARSMGFWKKLGVALGLVDPPYEKAK